MRIDLHFVWLLKDTAFVRKISHTHTEERKFDLIISINYIGSFIGGRMTSCAEELLPELLDVFFVCECGQMTSGPVGWNKSLYLSRG